MTKTQRSKWNWNSYYQLLDDTKHYNILTNKKKKTLERCEKFLLQGKPMVYPNKIVFFKLRAGLHRKNVTCQLKKVVVCRFLSLCRRASTQFLPRGFFVAWNTDFCVEKSLACGDIFYRVVSLLLAVLIFLSTHWLFFAAILATISIKKKSKLLKKQQNAPKQTSAIKKRCI